jgi:hypothetical protein
MTRRPLFVQLSVGLLAVLIAFGVGFLRGRTHPHKSVLPGSSPWTAPKFTLNRPETKDLSAKWTPIVEKYAGGVCVLTGRVMFVDGKGNPFRYNVKTWTERGELVADPNGQIYYRAFSGTGFHIGDGVVLSHVELFAPRTGTSLAIDGETDEPILSTGREYRRVPVDVTATFPGREKAFPMRTKGYRLVHYVPEFTFDLDGANIPVLPIPAGDASGIGDVQKGEELLMLGDADSIFGKKAESPKVLSLIEAKVEEHTFEGCEISFLNRQRMNPGFPIFNREGVVVGIFGRSLFFEPGVVFPERILTKELELLGAGYGPHRAKEKRGLVCECGPASGTDEHRP